MNSYGRVLLVFSSFLIPIHPLVAEIGDEWDTRRGDASPHLLYVDVARTSTGRIIAVSDGGGLMISDDDGANWEFGQIEVNGIRAGDGFGTIQFIDGKLIAIARTLKESPGIFRYVVQTTFYTSSDDGETWSAADFPIEYVQRGTKKLYGVNITELVDGPGGELLAYGTMTGSNNLFCYYHIGGVIFRDGPSGWEQAFYGFGPVFDIAVGGGRAIAAAHNGVLDSADGAGWNGYRLRDASVTSGSSPLDLDHLKRLRVRDVEIHNGTYIATAATFVPYKGSSFIDSSTVDNLYNLNSAAPFGGGFPWEAYEQTGTHGELFQTSSGLLGVGASGIFLSGNDAQSFTLATPHVRVPYGLAVHTGGTNYLAIESSEVVWESTDNGANWTKIRDEPSDYYSNIMALAGSFSGTIYGTQNTSPTNRDLFVSRDNGESWQLFQVGPTVDVPAFQLPNGDLISRAQGDIRVSSDGGETWTTKDLGTGGNTFAMTMSPTGRLIAPCNGSAFLWGPDGSPVFFSDDGGDTWVHKGTAIQNNESPRVTVVGKSGRIIIVLERTYPVIDTRVITSDDDGETWQSHDFETNDGRNYVEFEKLFVSPTGRLVAQTLSDRILTSDDEGETWIVRVDSSFNWTGSFRRWNLRGLAQVNGRWIATATYETPGPQYRPVQVILTSDDDGATWRERPFATNIESSVIQYLIPGEDGRIIASGQNFTIMTSDVDPPILANNPDVEIREGTIGQIPIERPPVDGALEIRYSGVQVTAIAHTDYQPCGGFLNWADGEEGTKTVSLETVDNDILDGERMLKLQLVFEDEEGVTGEIEIPISITDDDGGMEAGLLFEGAEHLYTSEQGESAALKISLEREPSADVAITISGDDPGEGTLSQKSFTFTPANWNRQQTLTITGVDDNFPDGDHSYSLIFGISSADEDYESLNEVAISVTNRGDEAYEVGGEFLLDPPAVNSGGPAARAALNRKLKKLKKSLKVAKSKGQAAKTKKIKSLIKKLSKKLKSL